MNQQHVERYGFKTGGNGPHSSRTLMLPEVSACLGALPVGGFTRGVRRKKARRE